MITETLSMKDNESHIQIRGCCDFIQDTNVTEFSVFALNKSLAHKKKLYKLADFFNRTFGKGTVKLSLFKKTYETKDYQINKPEIAWRRTDITILNEISGISNYLHKYNNPNRYIKFLGKNFKLNKKILCIKAMRDPQAAMSYVLTNGDNHSSYPGGTIYPFVPEVTHEAFHPLMVEKIKENCYFYDKIVINKLIKVDINAKKGIIVQLILQFFRYANDDSSEGMDIINKLINEQNNFNPTYENFIETLQSSAYKNIHKYWRIGTGLNYYKETGGGYIVKKKSDFIEYMENNTYLSNLIKTNKSTNNKFIKIF